MPPSIDTLLTHFTNTLRLSPRPTWLSHTLTTLRQPPASASLLATLKYRVLASNITESLQAHANLCFPATAHDVDVTSVIAGPVAVQVVGMEDVGVSRVEQLDRVEMVMRGEGMRGKEVVRIDDEGQGGGGGKNGPWKLLLEDAGGRRVYAIELQPVEGIGGDMAIGAKMVLRNVVVARGLLLLTPATTTFLGGKIDAMNQEWIANRKQSLQDAIEKLKAQG